MVDRNYRHDDEEGFCRGWADSAAMMAARRQGNLPLESAWENSQQMAALSPLSPWPSEQAREAQLRRAYEESVESTRSGKSDRLSISQPMSMKPA